MVLDYKKLRISIVLLFLFVTVTGCSGNLQGSEEGLVRIVMDGDTVQLADGRKIRYLGIDTPESRIREGGRWVYRPEPFADEATELNKRLVLGKVVRLEYDNRMYDKYNRHLCYVFIGDIFVNAEILRQGFARIYDDPANVKYERIFIEAEHEAKRNQLGIWQ